jgi:DNA-binding MarR family transcriptional regulator
MDYFLLEKLLPHLKKFESQQDSAKDLENFAVYLHYEVVVSKEQDKSNLPIDPWETLEGSLSKLLVLLSRYAKYYTKSALEISELANAEEFGFLITLMVRSAMSKSDLIKANLLEKSTGTEIIKRLMVKSYIESFKAPSDQRKTLVKITESGRAALYTSFGPMSDVAQMITSCLTESEKVQLFKLLHKLHLFHHPRFEQFYHGRNIIPDSEG